MGCGDLTNAEWARLESLSVVHGEAGGAITVG
jgi:hypothetical protein